MSVICWGKPQHDFCCGHVCLLIIIITKGFCTKVCSSSVCCANRSHCKLSLSNKSHEFWIHFISIFYRPTRKSKSIDPCVFCLSRLHEHTTCTDLTVVKQSLIFSFQTECPSGDTCLLNIRLWIYQLAAGLWQTDKSYCKTLF